MAKKIRYKPLYSVVSDGEGGHKLQKNVIIPIKPRRKKKDPSAEKKYLRNKTVKKMAETKIPKTKEVVFEPMRIVPRRLWDPTYTTTSKEPVRQFINESYPDEKLMAIPIGNVIFSYTNTDVCNSEEECKQTMREILKNSLEQNLPDIPYNFLVGGDGTIYEGRGWRRLPEVNDRFGNLYGNCIEIAHVGHEGTTPFLTQTVSAWDFVNFGVKCAVLAYRPLFHTVYH